MLASEKLAIAAHLHVLLRRTAGRVTDTEWMASNAEYAAAMVQVARAVALEGPHPELADWAGRLEQAWAQPTARPRAPLLPRGGSPASAPAGPGAAEDAPRYIGGLR